MVATIENVELVYEGWGRFLLVRIRREDGSILTQQLDDHGEGVAVLPYDPDRKVVTVVRQVRPSTLYTGRGVMVLEAPSGRLDTDDPEACAKREALEESGLKIAELEHIGTFWISPATSTERAHLYLGRYSEADRLSAGGGLREEGEQIIVEEVPISRILAMADSGELDDVKTFCAVQALRLRHPELCA
jgi:nudix-type nucleoside diphosphatase (YffH/AdpP family)